MAEKFTNFAESLISGAVENTDTTISVTAGTGLLFPTLTGGNFFRVVAYKFATGEREVMKVTARATDVMTVTRAQEGTSALDLNDGDLFELRPTAAFFTSMATTAQIQEGTPNYAVAGGTANALTIALTPTVTAYATGTVLRIKAAADNTTSATINADGVGAKTIKKVVSGAKANLAAGDLKTGIVYTIVYDGTDFLLQGPQPVGTAAAYAVGTGAGDLPTNADIVFFLPGMTMDYAGASAPSGWLLCYGQAVSRTTYADLFGVISTIYGVGDGTTTFNLPDLRGRVVAGQDDMGGTSANRLTNQAGGLDGDVLGAAGGTETHTLTTTQMPSHTHAIYADAKASFSSADQARVQNTPGPSSVTSAATGGDGAHNNVQPTFVLNKIIKT